MPQPLTLKIVEIFPSLQGEGLRQGEPTIFVRLSGCNLACRFCDTKYAWEGGRDLAVAEILERIKKIRERFPSEWICLTGGEPLLQDIGDLVRGLKTEGFKVQVETNATIYQPLAVDWYSVSPKPEKFSMRPEYSSAAKEVKLVVTQDLSLEAVKKLRRKFPQNTPILLQPQSNREWSLRRGKKLLKEALRAGLKNVRISIQLQKILGVR